MSPEQSLNLVTSHIFYLDSQKEIIQIIYHICDILQNLPLARFR